ncbi:TonB-dependent receptor [Arenibacter palladensis]|uniref:TonB-dependent receptor n=1 Tax=Arenibacter palladensis TaxID=237373 RepID=UPI002FD2BCBD
MELEKVPLQKVFEEIESLTDFKFLYDNKKIDAEKLVSVKVKNRPISDVLDNLFKDTSIYYLVRHKQIVLKIQNTPIPDKINKETKIIVAEEKLVQQVISGTVTDDKGQPLPGANVVEKGTTNGVTADFDGSFTIIPKNESPVLVISYVGFSTQEVVVDGQTNLSISMNEDAAGLEEVVIVGYGTQKKINLTGAVETIDSEDINWKPVGQTSMALQGVAAGVTVTQNSGQPGNDGGTIRIRGIGTLGTAGQAPLVLVDGVETNLNTVDPSDIQNISVLKDAASAAIYGSRAANGVILVTTKRSTSNEIKVNYNGYLGSQTPTDLPQLVSGLDHMLLLNEANQNLGQSPTFQESYIEEYRRNSPSDLYPDTDWQELTLKTGWIQNHSFDVSGGSDPVQFRVSYNRFDQTGLIANTSYTRNSIRINTDIKPSDQLTFKIDIKGSDEKDIEPAVGANNVFYNMNGRVPANQEGILSDGRWGQGWLGANSIAYAHDSGTSRVRDYSAIINLQGEWKPFSGFKINLMYAPEFQIQNGKKFTRTIETYFGDGRLAYLNPNINSLVQGNAQTKTENFRALVNYNKALQAHNFNVLGGYEQIGTHYESFQASRENFPFEDFQQLSLGSEINQGADGSGFENSLRSIFSRLNYDYKGKYLIEANLRYDGSSRFASGRKYGLYPSFSLGWRITEENFLKESEFLNNLKMRASWGRLGNQNIGNYPFASSVYLEQGYILNEIAVPGASLTELGNPDISWETTEMSNVGIDIGFLNKFSITADYYIRNTEDILLNLPIPLTVGLGSPFQNAGKVKNTGWDLGITHSNTVGDLNYGVTFTLADVKNEIVDLKDSGPFIADRTIRTVGQPIDALYGYETDGLFQTQEEVDQHATQFGGQVAPGDIKYVDQNGDGEITADGDRVVFGSSIPRYTYSLNLNASYKGFDLSMFFQGVGKADSYRDRSGVWAFYVGSTALVQHLDRWTPENTDASYPRLTFAYPNNEQVSDYWKLNAAYLRLKNLQLGYSIPNKSFDNSFIDGVRFYVSGQNLFTIDKFLKGLDVEVPLGTGGFYPIVKTITLGTNIKF